MNLVGIAAALRGMFSLRPNSPAHIELLENLEELKTITHTERHNSEFEETMRRVVEAAGK